VFSLYSFRNRGLYWLY